MKKPAKENDFSAIFQTLRALLRKYEKYCDIDRNSDTEYFLNHKGRDEKGKPIFFAAAGVNKITVSYYLMGIHCHPLLGEGMSPELRKRLTGKSCFRFKKAEPELFEELGRLTKQCMDWHRKGEAKG